MHNYLFKLELGPASGRYQLLLIRMSPLKVDTGGRNNGTSIFVWDIYGYIRLYIYIYIYIYYNM
jgi:hypothetical protein